MKIVILFIFLMSVLAGCAPHGSDKINDKPVAKEQDQIQACIEKMEVRTVEEAVVRGYRLRACNLPETVDEK